MQVICQEDGEGTMVIADLNNHRLQLLDKRLAEWSIIHLEPHLLRPQRAMYVDGALYVESGEWPHYELCKYIAK